MRMRRVFIIFVSSILLAATGFGSVALAEDSYTSDGVTLSNIRTSPDSLPGSGQVSITVHMAVDTSREAGGISNVHIEGTGVSSDYIDNIPIAGEADLHCTLFLNEDQLGKQITLSAKWEGSGEGIPFAITVPSSTPDAPQVTFTRTMDKTSVAAGGTVNIIYNVKNTGLVDITDLVVTDEGIGTSMSLTQSSLKAGSTTALPYSYTVDADFTSKPVLTYKAGGKTYTANCPAKTVALKIVQLDAVLRAITPDVAKSGDEVTLVCDLVNTGNMKLTSIVISEATLGNKLFTAASLEKDATMQFSKKIMLTQTTKFQYVITAKDDAGHTYTTKSNELEVIVESGSDQYNIEIMASPDAIQLAEPGKVSFEITITNKGTEPVSNVSVLDQNGLVLKAFETLATGVTQIPYDIVIDKTTGFNFSVVVPGTDNTNNYQRSTGLLEIKVTDATATPVATNGATASPSPADTETAASTSGSASPSNISTILTAMLVVGVLIIITIIVLVVMIISDKKKRKR